MELFALIYWGLGIITIGWGIGRGCAVGMHIYCPELTQDIYDCTVAFIDSTKNCGNSIYQKAKGICSKSNAEVGILDDEIAPSNFTINIDSAADTLNNQVLLSGDMSSNQSDA